MLKCRSNSLLNMNLSIHKWQYYFIIILYKCDIDTMLSPFTQLIWATEDSARAVWYWGLLGLPRWFISICRSLSTLPILCTGHTTKGTLREAKIEKNVEFSTVGLDPLPLSKVWKNTKKNLCIYTRIFWKIPCSFSILTASLIWWLSESIYFIKKILKEEVFK